MFEISNSKTFMDSVHGYITVPRCFVENLIDTEYFQRLRNIDQTGMRILYPDGKHDRFCHSLGVYHLGCKAVDSLLNNFSKDKYWNIRSDRDSVVFWAKNKILFLIACLLHDVGHAPFSHSLENEIYHKSGGFGFTIKLVELINSMESDVHNTQDHIPVNEIDITAAAHEQIGAMLVLDRLKENIERIFDELAATNYPILNEESILFAEYYNYNPIINKEELNTDLSFIARMILGLKYKEYTPEKQIRNCFIELINGNNFDVDKLDYIIRDTKMSGICNVSIDVERLLNSICIVTKTQYNEYEFNKTNQFSNYTIHEIKNNTKKRRILIKGNLKGVFTFQRETEINVFKGSTFVSFGTPNGEARIKYLDDYTKFAVSTEVYKDGECVKEQNGEKRLHDNINGTPFNCSIKNAKVISDSGFHVVVEQDSVIMEINGFCNIEISGEFFSRSSVKFFDSTEVTGDIDRLVVLGNLIKNETPNFKCYNAFSIGFKKQAINIIANVLEARDYLYLWCYAHHKITYYANFLIPATSERLLQNDQNTVFPSWSLDYDNIDNLDDSYLWTIIRFLKDKKEQITNDLCGELLSRKYKNSLWKSLAEYDLLFEEFTDLNKQKILHFFAQNIEKEKPNVFNGNYYTAGFIREELLSFLKKSNSLIDEVKNIIFVAASYSRKYTDIYNTFILINNDVVPMDRIQILTDKIKTSYRNTPYYFYLYYDTFSNDKISIEAEKSLINSIKDFLNNRLDSIANLDVEDLENESL